MWTEISCAKRRKNRNRFEPNRENIVCFPPSTHTTHVWARVNASVPKLLDFRQSNVRCPLLLLLHSEISSASMSSHCDDATLRTHKYWIFVEINPFLNHFFRCCCRCCALLIRALQETMRYESVTILFGFLELNLLHIWTWHRIESEHRANTSISRSTVLAVLAPEDRTIYYFIFNSTGIS